MQRVEKQRIYGLDILRAVAILCVIIPHSLAIIKPVIPEFFFNIIPDGVLIFFVLSGFLIGGILLRTINKSRSYLFKFWVRRWLRTLPAYFVVLIIIFIYNRSFDYRYVFFIQNISNGNLTLFVESWSLSIEEWFYLIVPILLFFSVKFFPKRQVVLFWIVFIIISVAAFRIYRAKVLHNVEEWDIYSRRALLTRIDCIMYGFLGAYLTYYKLWKKVNLLFIVGAAILLINICIGFLGFSDYTKYFYFITQSIAVLLMLPKLNDLKTGKGFLYKFFTYVSRVSYSLYLVNFTLFFLFIYPLTDNIFTQFLLFYLWAFAASWVVYTLVEKPFMNLRDKGNKKTPATLSSHQAF